ncbi:hypothetical protein CRENPOLYSF2_160001 [Crenothrix polyspora]|uniref:Uncharacterized protein n=1 Tax=Crenothrix polyspora TaxID=360316 RepID=A0A1R4H256_9GAMM|nr:hypothetical protein CRENPOLYSF2_160001 [Crenothrix polyspora]
MQALTQSAIAANLSTSPPHEVIWIETKVDPLVKTKNYRV